MEEKPENFAYVEMSLTLMYTALTELCHISKIRSKSEVELLNGLPFLYYRVSLQYMFTMEFIKLLEKDSNSHKNFASLAKLSNTIYQLKGAEFRSKHTENEEIIEKIRKTSLFKLIQENRHKKFAHIDRDYPGDPWSIKGLSIEEIKEGLRLIKLMKKIHGNCTGVYDYEFSFDHPDSRTNNFIVYHALYKDYYDKHIKEAMEEGFYPKPGNSSAVDAICLG